MFMKSALAAARRRGDDLMQRAGGVVGGSAFMMGGGSQGSLGTLAKQTSMAQHNEQMRHFWGWPYAVIRTIAQRIAGQPLRVARVLAEDEVRRIEQGRMQTKGFARWRRMMLRRPSKESLPACYKDLQSRLEVLDSHEIISLVARPNPIMTRWAMIFSTFAGLELTGKSYWWFHDDPQGGLQIWPLPAGWVEPEHDEFELFARWKVTPPGLGVTITVPGNRIGYMYYPDPANPLGALAPLQANARSVVADEAILDAQRRGFSQGIFPGMGVVIGRHPDVAGVPGMRPILTKDQRATLIAAIKQAYRGVMNADEPIILDGLIEDVKKLTNSPREMDFMESGKNTKERITQGWGVNPISMGQIEGANRACHDTETELLTLRGWMRYGEVKAGDVAGTMNPDTGRFEWQAVSHVHVYPNYCGEMIRLSGAKIDALVTPDHRMWTRRGQRGGKLTPDSGYGFKTASDLCCHDVLPLSPLPQVGARVNTFVLPGVEDGRGARRNGSLLDVPVQMDAWLEFIGWFVSEGWTLGLQGRKKSRAVGIRQAVGSIEECRRIRACMEALRIRKVHVFKRRAYAGYEMPDMYDRQASETYMIYDKRLWAWLRDNCGIRSASKRLPGFLFGLPAEQSARTLEAMLLGDGSHRKATEERKYSGLHAAYFTKSRTLADQTQTLSVLCGRAARIGKDRSNGVHTVGVSEYSREMSLLPKHISREKYSGTVWCVTVPNGLIVTRRNGKTLVSGNSSATADDHLCANVINPRLMLISEIMTRWMPPLFGEDPDRTLVYFETAKAFDPDMERTNDQFLQSAGAVSRNELRAKYGWGPIKEGDSCFVQGFGEVLIQPEVDDTPPDDDGGDEDDGKGFDDPSGPGYRCWAKQLGDKGVVKLWLRNHGRGERRMAREIRDHWIKVGHQVNAALRSLVAGGGKITEEAIGQAFCHHEQDHALRKRVEPHAKALLLVGAVTEWELYTPRRSHEMLLSRKSEEMASVRLRLPNDVLSGIDKAAARLMESSYWSDIVSGVKADMIRVLKDSITEGLSGKETADRIQRECLGINRSASRAENIARTESTLFLNAGHEETRQKLNRLGLLKAKRWAAIVDGSTRPEHAHADGQQVGPDDDFKLSNGESAKFPGDTRLTAGQRCRCRCTVLSVTVGPEDL